MLLGRCGFDSATWSGANSDFEHGARDVERERAGAHVIAMSFDAGLMLAHARAISRQIPNRLPYNTFPRLPSVFVAAPYSGIG